MDGPRPERVALSRDLSEFLVELSIALHRHSMYPSGHPSLGPAIASVTRRADRLLVDRSSIAFGVARRQLIIEGMTTDPEQPVLRRLAEGLHRHHIGAISIARGVVASEMAAALGALASDAERDGPLGLRTGASHTSWPHVRLHPLTFDGLTIVSDGEAASDGEGQPASRGVALWVGLARAALSSDPSGSVTTEPSVVARAIDEHPRAEAYDQVIVGYLLQIATELKHAADEGRADELRRRTSRLIAALRPDTLRRLVTMGGDATQRDRFVLDATHGMAVDAVLEIVKAAADASGQTISHGLIRMLSKLAMHAEIGSARVRSRADVELREQVTRLIEDWRLEDPNPELYGRILHHLATAPQQGATAAPVVHGEADPVRIVQMSLEASAWGPLAATAVDRLIEDGHVDTVLGLVATRPDTAGEVGDAVMSRLTRPESLDAIVSREPIDVASLDTLIPRLSADGYKHLLQALASSPNRATRRRLLDRLSGTSADIGELVVQQLDDERWYVQRNMLMLLGRMGRLPERFSAIQWTMHPDPRVRSEAVRLQLAMPREREIGIAAALHDTDDRVVRLGLAAVQQDCPMEIVTRVIHLATADATPDENRVLAVTALARIRHVSALDALLRLVDGGRTLLGRIRLPPKTPALLAALGGLARMWSQDPRAASVLAVAAASSDPDVRDATTRVPT